LPEGFPYRWLLLGRGFRDTLMAEITILHLSDLHYDPKRRVDQGIVLKALWDDLATLCEEGISPDLIIFSGDLVNKGDDASAYEEAKENFIEPLLKTTGLHSDCLFIVPGNHDVQVSEIKDAQKKEQVRYLMKMFMPIAFQAIVHETLGSEKLGEIIGRGVRALGGRGGLVAMMYVFLYADLRQQNYLDCISELARESRKHRYALEVIFYRLFMYYMLRKLSAKEGKKLIQVIADVFMSMEGSGQRTRDERLRSRFINDLKTRFLRAMAAEKEDKLEE
jgi:hypothetical protein